MKALKEELDSFQKEWNAQAPDGLQAAFERGMEETKAIQDIALKVGDSAPDFRLKNALGREIQLSDLLQNGPVVLTWYRGGWCPYCNIQLRYLQAYLPNIKKTGATLVALTPELPDKSLSTKEKNELEFEVLTDYNNEVARQFHLVFHLNEELVGLYNSFHKLENYNGVDSNELPVPATYVIDRDFTIRYAFVNTDYRKRAEPDSILESLKRII